MVVDMRSGRFAARSETFVEVYVLDDPIKCIGLGQISLRYRSLASRGYWWRYERALRRGKCRPDSIAHLADQLRYGAVCLPQPNLLLRLPSQRNYARSCSPTEFTASDSLAQSRPQAFAIVIPKLYLASMFANISRKNPIISKAPNFD